MRRPSQAAARQAPSLCCVGSGARARPRWPSQRSTCRGPRGRWCLHRASRGRELAGPLHAELARGGRSRREPRERVGRQQRRARQALSLLEGPLHSGGSSSPMLMVAWRLMTSGESAFSFAGSIVARSCFARCELFEAGAAGSSDILAAAIASVAEATAAMLCARCETEQEGRRQLFGERTPADRRNITKQESSRTTACGIRGSVDVFCGLLTTRRFEWSRPALRAGWVRYGAYHPKSELPGKPADRTSFSGPVLCHFGLASRLVALSAAERSSRAPR